MSDMVCADCGARNSRPVEFCVACGAFLAWDAGTTAVPEVSGTTPRDRPATVPVATAATGAFPDDDDRPTARWTFGATARPARRSAGSDLVDPEAGALGTVQAPTAPTAAPTAAPTGSGASPAGPSGCPRCGVPVADGRRFCGRCGFQLVHPTADAVPTTATPAARKPWWRRRPGDADRAAWRRSLPVRYRVRRWLFGLLGIGVLFGGLTLIGRDPVGWLGHRWNDLRDVQVVVGNLTAVGVPAEIADAPGGAAVDRRLDTAWATAWTPGATAAADCAAPQGDADPAAPSALLVGLPGTRDVRTVRIHPGPPTAEQRAVQPRPKQLRIGWATGCVTVELPDSAEPTTAAVDITASTVWVTVTDVWPSATPTVQQQVSLTEVEFLARP